MQGRSPLPLNMAKARDWCFTINDIPQLPAQAQEVLERIRTRNMGDTRFIAAQLEVAPVTGHLHIQGYIVCNSPVRMTAAQTKIQQLSGTMGQPHMEPRRGTHQQAADYANKEETRMPNTQPVRRGELPADKPGGKGKALDAACKILLDGGTMDDVMMEEPTAFAAHFRGLQEIERRVKRKKIEYDNVTLKPWQADLATKLMGTPHPREILWYYDPDGNKGKTWMGNYLYDVLNSTDFQVALLGNQKTADVAYSLSQPKIVIFDFTRAQEETLNWSLIEQMKNGTIFSPKYESQLKRFPTPHTICFSNFDPEIYYNKLSADRWNVTRI